MHGAALRVDRGFWVGGWLSGGWERWKLEGERGFVFSKSRLRELGSLWLERK